MGRSMCVSIMGWCWRRAWARLRGSAGSGVSFQVTQEVNERRGEVAWDKGEVGARERSSRVRMTRSVVR